MVLPKIGVKILFCNFYNSLKGLNLKINGKMERTVFDCTMIFGRA